MPSQPLRIGVLLVDSVQLLDLSAVDLLYMTTPDYLSDCELPRPLVELGRPCEIHYIGRDGANAQSPTTSQLKLRLTDSLTDAAVAPGKLDVLVVPGPAPKAMPPAEEYMDFLRRHHAAGVDILSICTGILVVAHSGLVHGKKVTAPRALIPALRKRFPEAALWDDSMRVVRDGNLWTSGGITNGHDLVAEYLREHYPAPLVNSVLAMADVAQRPLQYESGPMRDNVFFLWQILNAIPSTLSRLIWK